MRDKHIRNAAIPLLTWILFAFAPQSIAAPSGPDAILEATSKDLAYLEVELRSKKDEEPVRFQLKGYEGLVAGGITLPAGSANYEITAFDGEGKVIYFGKGSIPSLMTGDPPVQISLPPANPEEGRNDGLIVSLSRERLVLEAKPLDEPNSFTIQAHVTDPRGNSVPLDPNEVRWGITDPTHFELQRLEGEFTMVDLRPRKEKNPGDTVITAGVLCDAPPHVVMCLPNRSCRAVRVCDDPWVAISAGHSHTCALKQSGAAFCWGSNSFSELGAPSTDTCIAGSSPSCSTRPVRVQCPAGEPCRFTQIAAGRDFTVATDFNGNTWSWGRGATAHRRVSAARGAQQLNFEQITAGDGYGCGLVKGGDLWCWGDSDFGQTGAPVVMTSVPFDSAVNVLPPIRFAKVVAGDKHTCAVHGSRHEVACWGRDDSNQTTGSSSMPFANSHGQFFSQQFGGPVSILDVAVSADSSCVTLGNGLGINCWGSNSSLDLVPLGTPDHLAVGADHVCTISAQTASCVGANFAGQLGIGSLMDPGTPVTPNAPPAEFESLSTGTAHTCGVTPSGDAYCWGRALEGQIGNGASNWGVLAPAEITVP